MPKYYSEDFELCVKQDYENGMKIKDIIKKWKCSGGYIDSVRRKHKLVRYTFNYEEAKNKFNIAERISFVAKSGKKEYYYITPCNSCGKENKLVVSHLKRLEKDGKYLCDECSNKGENKQNRTASFGKRKNNTTGYIGVIVDIHHGKIKGYRAVINHKGSRILKNRYKDDSLHYTTLIQAVIDRDLFIIEKKLPHKRNLTDTELFANMEYLAYKNIDNIRDILNKDKK